MTQPWLRQPLIYVACPLLTAVLFIIVLTMAFNDGYYQGVDDVFYNSYGVYGMHPSSFLQRKVEHAARGRFPSWLCLGVLTLSAGLTVGTFIFALNQVMSNDKTQSGFYQNAIQNGIRYAAEQAALRQQLQNARWEVQQLQDELEAGKGNPYLARALRHKQQSIDVPRDFFNIRATPDETQTLCVICRDNLPRHNIAETSCKHRLCRDCLADWVEKSARCPLCSRMIYDSSEVVIVSRS